MFMGVVGVVLPGVHGSSEVEVTFKSLKENIHKYLITLVSIRIDMSALTTNINDFLRQWKNYCRNMHCGYGTG